MSGNQDHKVTLGEVLSLEYGKPLSKEKRATSGKYPVFGANGIKCYTSEPFHPRSSIIVGRKGTAGAVNLVEGGFWPLDVTYFVTFDESQYDLKYLYYLLLHLDLPKLAKGVKPGINRNNVYAIKCRIPLLQEQKRIVAILDEAFAGIETVIANTEKNLANAHELFNGFLVGSLSSPDDSWKFRTLKDVCLDYGRGKSKHRPRNDPSLYGGDYPFIQTGDVRRSDHKIVSYSATYNDRGLAQSKLWPRGTICITIAANIAETGVLEFDACFPDSIIGLVIDESQAVKEYVEFLLQSVKAVLKAKGKGSAQDNINLATFENETFPFPPLEVQRTIVQRLESLRSGARQLEKLHDRKLEALQELKQSLLRKAFSGELAADRAEREVESVAV